MPDDTAPAGRQEPWGKVPRAAAAIKHGAWVRVYVALASYANGDGTCHPSLAALEDATGLNRRTLQRSLDSLEEEGWVAREHTGRATRYRLLGGGPQAASEAVHRPPQRRSTGRPLPVPGGGPQAASEAVPGPRARRQGVEQTKEQTSNALPSVASPPAPPAPREPSRAADVRAVFDAWVTSCDAAGMRGGARKLTDVRRKAVMARLNDGYPVEDLIDAARGWLYDPWEQRPQQNDLAILMRPTNVERMRDFARQGPTRRLTPFEEALSGLPPGGASPALPGAVIDQRRRV